MTTNADVVAKAVAEAVAWAAVALADADVGATMKTRAETTLSGVVVQVGLAVIDSVAIAAAKWWTIVAVTIQEAVAEDRAKIGNVQALETDAAHETTAIVIQ